jgi:hypothetical protein
LMQRIFWTISSFVWLLGALKLFSFGGPKKQKLNKDFCHFVRFRGKKSGFDKVGSVCKLFNFNGSVCFWSSTQVKSKIGCKRGCQTALLNEWMDYFSVHIFTVWTIHIVLCCHLFINIGRCCPPNFFEATIKIISIKMKSYGWKLILKKMTEHHFMPKIGPKHFRYLENF